jgi:benzoyl-CoA reductase subunit C
VGFLCPYTVEEIVHAAGFTPVRISPPRSSRELADAYIPANFCPYLRHVVDLGVRGAFSEYRSVIVAHSCDGARRAIDVLREYTSGVDLFFLDLPKRADESAVSYFRGQLVRMTRFFEELSGKPVSDKDLRSAIDLYNENRRLLERIYTLRESSPSMVSSETMVRLLEVNAVNSKERTNPLLERTIEELESSVISSTVDSQGKKRIFVSGNLLDYGSFLSEIEAAGGAVVGDDFCFGGRYYCGEADPGEDPLQALARRYLSRVPCGRMENYKDRFDRLVERVNLSKARGVVYLGLKFCDNFLTDYPILKVRLDGVGIPSLLLESEYFPAGTGQLRTRIEAFIEMID